MSVDAAPHPTPEQHQRSDDRTFLGWMAMLIALGALVLGFFALGRGGGDESAAAGTGPAADVAYVDLALGALKLEPNHLMAEPGHVIVRVTNVDSQVHNVTINGVKSPDVQPDETVELDLGELA